MGIKPDAVKAKLTREQYSLYKLIYTRFLASQMKPAAFETVTLELHGRERNKPNGGVAELRYYGEHMTFQGYRAVYVESEDDEAAAPETAMPDLKEGDAATITGVETVQHFTQPPARYTEASLVKTLEEKGIAVRALRADHHHHPGPRLRTARRNASIHGTGQDGYLMLLVYFAPIVVPSLPRRGGQADSV
jgi:DNA topoisomerase IA